MARWFRSVCYLLARPFGLRVSHYPTMPRFHIPLIEPYLRVSRIRLSDRGFPKRSFDFLTRRSRTGLAVEAGHASQFWYR